MTIEHILEDWSAVQRRWETWWQCELHDRVVLCVTAPREGVASARDLEVNPETQWTDVNYMVRHTLETIRTTYYGGEAIPWWWNPISAGYALLFGCRPHYRKDTMWVDPAPVGVDGYPALDGWRDSPWLSWIRGGIEAAVRAGQGRYFVLPFWGNHAGDILAVVRGPEQFLMDIADNPGWVRSAVRRMTDIQLEIYHDLCGLIMPEITGVEGTLNYVGCWSPGRTLAFDCDISCNISSRAFQDLFLGPLVEWMRLVDHRIYHLDGRGALHHLDLLLSLPELHAIQWVPGAGHEEIMQWVPLIRAIQRRGKGVAVNIRPEEVEPLLGEVSAEGLCITTRCRTEEEARALLKHVAQIGGQGRRQRPFSDGMQGGDSA